MIGSLHSLGYGRIGVVAGVSAAVVAAAFGTGYTTTRALSNDQSAWLRKGVTIAHVNGPSARYDAVVANQPVALARSAADDLQVVQEPDGQVYTADPVTHQVFRIDLNTMTPGPSTTGKAVLAAGSQVYVLNPGGRTLTPVDPQSLAPGRPIILPAQAVSEVAASDGTLYVGEQDGAVSVVRGGRVRTVQLAPAGDPLQVTVAGTQPVAVDQAAARVYPVGSGSASIPLPGPPGAPVQVGDNQASGQIWLVQGVQLVSVDLESGQAQPVTLPSGHQYEAPAVDGGRVYVPDRTASAVLVYDASLMTLVQTIPVPAGAPGQSSIEVVVKSGQVWIDNPTSRDAKVVDPGGSIQTIDKGTGDGVVDPNAPKPAAPPSSRPAAHPPSPQGNPVIPAPPAVVTSPVNAGPPAPAVPAAAGPPPTRPAVTLRPPPPPTSSPRPRVAPPTPPAPARTAPSATTSTTPTVPAGPAPVAVPGNLVGQPYGSACAELQSKGLACIVAYLAQAAPSGKAGQVVAARPSGGSVKPGSTVQLDVDKVAVPSPAAGESYSSYCATINSLLLTCNPKDQGQGPTTAQVSAVTTVSPGAGTLQPPAPSSVITVDYYSSAAAAPPPPPPQTETVPDCTNLTSSQCSQAMSAVNLVGVGNPQTSPSYACDQVSGPTSPAAGQVVNQGTSVSIPYNAYCAQPRYEYHETDSTTDSNIYYLGFSPPGYGAWSQVSGDGYAYPLVNGACPKPGTGPVYQFVYPPTTGVARYAHYNYSMDPNWYLGHQGWNPGTAVACEFASGGAGRTAVYVVKLGQSPYTKNHQPFDYEWTTSGGTLVWYRPDSP